MSKTKSSGLSRLGRDSRAQRLGIKIFAGQFVKTGMIIVRQRGTKFLPGKNVKLGSDDTIFAMQNGIVKFSAKRKRAFNGTQRMVKIVNVEPQKTK
jgi:large subunit ribosomal protein L27